LYSKKYWQKWASLIKKATRSTIPSERLEREVQSARAHVSVSHLVLDHNGNFDRKNPVFIEGSFLWKPEICELHITRDQCKGLNETLAIVSEQQEIH